MSATDDSRVILITGGTSGLGFEAAQQMARLGHRVVVHGRNEERGRDAVERLREASGNREVHLLACDYTSLNSVRDGANEFRERFGRLDVLVNNAAMNPWGARERRETEDGLELFFTVNYLSHYLLTRSLLDLLVKSAPSRIVNVGARQMKARFDFDDLQMTRDWSGFRAILQAKLGMFCMTRELGRQLAGTGVTVNILDPGLVDTNYQEGAGRFFRLILRLIGTPASRAAETYTWLATSPEVADHTGLLFAGRKRLRFKGEAADDAIAARIWAESARLVGLPPSLDASA